jgi:hypothetical protein
MSSVKALDNANPTILSAAELPTRRQQRKGRDASSKVEGIRAILMANPSDALDPFYLSDFSDTDSDDSTIEPIDEQEIYGKFNMLRSFLTYVRSTFSSMQSIKVVPKKTWFQPSQFMSWKCRHISDN